MRSGNGWNGGSLPQAFKTANLAGANFSHNLRQHIGCRTQVFLVNSRTDIGGGMQPGEAGKDFFDPVGKRRITGIQDLRAAVFRQALQIEQDQFHQLSDGAGGTLVRPSCKDNQVRSGCQDGINLCFRTAAVV